MLLALAGCSGGGTDKPSVTAPPPSTVSSSPAAITGPASPSATQSFSAPEQKLFAPYDENGTLVVQTSGVATGTCWTSSIAIPVAGVFRCLVNNQILDPCFAPAVDTDPLTVTCFADPWDPGTKVTLTTALPKDHLILKSGDPWALALGNGVHCVILTGALPEIGQDVIDYGCDNHDVASLQTSADGVISVLYGPQGGPLKPMAIVTSFRGQSFRFGSD